MPKPLRALTVRQPWAQLIMRGGKDIENRDWFTYVRERVAIHSSAKTTKADLDDACAALRLIVPNFSAEIFKAEAATYENGAILGTVRVVACVKSSDSPWFFGRYGFVLRDPVVLAQPIPIKGALGFWEVPAEIAELIERGEVARG